MTFSNRMIGLVFVAIWIFHPHTSFAVESAVNDAQQARVELIKKAAATVVAVFGSEGDGGGSGVLISADGFALSNYHVTSACGEFMKCGLNNGVLYDAVIVGVDKTGDVALLQLLGRTDFPFATLGDSDQLAVGEWTYAMGNPFLLANDFQPTVTYGMISGLHRYQYPAGTFLEYTDCIQVDTSINPGNSGGPLFNSKGELVGINGRIAVEKRGRVNVGAGYAISINQIKHFMGQLKGGRNVDHATLGAGVRAGSDRAVLVDTILESSDAYRRGLREDDEIVSFAGRPIGSVNQFKNILGIYPKGWVLPLVYRRAGLQKEILVELPALHRSSELDEPTKPAGPGPNRRPRNTPGDPHEGPDHDAANELPEKYKAMYEKKSGFANYYFNRLEQQRVLDHFAVYAGWKGQSGRWLVSGKTADGDSVQIKLLPKAISIKFDRRPPGLQPLDDSEYLDEPPRTGGLLAALHQFKLFLTEGSATFTDFWYEGSQPLDGESTQVDVVISRKSATECRWYFRSSDGVMLGFDCSLSPNVDPCKIRFLKHSKFEGREFPSQISIRHGDTEFANIEISRIEISPADRTTQID